MKITFIYHLYNNSVSLEKSIKSLLNQTNHNFEVIFIDDFASDECKNILSKFDFSDSKFKIVRLFENYGKSFSYNLGLEKANGEYVYFAEHNNLFDEHFVEEIVNISKIKKYDYISFKTNAPHLNDDISQNVELINNSKDSNISSWIVNCSITLRNKVFRKSFLEKNKIVFTNYKNLYPLYLFEVLTNYEVAYFTAKTLINFEKLSDNSIRYTYNLYDILESAFILSFKISESHLDSNLQSCFQVWLPKLCIEDFLFKMFESYTSEKILSIAITKAWETLEKIDVSYKKNKSLNLLINTNLKDYIKEFKPTYNYVKKNLIS